MSSENLETRKRILDAALALLESGDAQAVRMADIAKKTGISRQAVYLHFATRAELLIATTRHLDELRDVQNRLTPSRSAKTGMARLDAYVEAWGGYIPEMYGVGKALMAMSDTDEAAAEAWNERMMAMREGCEAAIHALKRDDTLSTTYSVAEATDMLWTLLSVRNWEQLTQACGWSQKKYIKTMKATARRLFVREN